MISKQYMTWSKAAFVLVLVLGVFGAGALPPGYAQAAPQSPNATATLYPGGSVTSGYLETLWGGTGSSRVLAPQTFLFGNGIPAPNLNPLSNSNSWRSVAPAGGSVQFTGGALRLYSPPSGQTGWHNANNTAACFGGCLGSATGARIFSSSADVVFQQRLNSGDQILGIYSIVSVVFNQMFLATPRWAGIQLMIDFKNTTSYNVPVRMWWFDGSNNYSSPVEACPLSAPYGVAYRLVLNSNGSVTGYVRCTSALTNDYDTFVGTKFETLVGTTPANSISSPATNGYLINLNVFGGQISATQHTYNYIRVQSGNGTTSGQYTSPAIDGNFGAQWSSVSCSGVETYGSGAGSISVFYRVWDSSAPGWTYLGTCNADTTLSIPGTPRARYFQAMFDFNPGSNGYRRLGGAAVNYNPDNTSPACTASPPPNPGTWVSGNTSVTVTCTDNESLMPNGQASQSYGHTLNANQGNQTVSGTACNRAGLCTNYSFSPYNRDSLNPNAPSVTLGGFTGVPPWNPTTVSYAHNGDNGPSGVNRIECSIIWWSIFIS